MPDLLTGLMVHLADAGITRRPDTAGALPPFWRAPDGGPPAPGEKKGTGNDAVTIVSAYITGEVPRSPGLGYSDKRIVDVRIRTKDPLVGPALGKQLVDELAPSPYGYRQAYDLGGLFVVESLQWRGLQLAGQDPAQGFDWVVAFRFETLA